MKVKEVSDLVGISVRTLHNPYEEEARKKWGGKDKANEKVKNMTAFDQKNPMKSFVALPSFVISHLIPKRFKKELRSGISS